MNADTKPAKAIFIQAVERHTPMEWPAFLDQACAGNSELRGEVEALLAAHREAATAEHRQATEGADSRPLAAVSAPRFRERAGTVIGPYKLLEQIGEGGMGAVFLAEQAHPVQRQVATKIIKPGMDSRSIIARFEAERQALALMDHPNIARVLDAGTTDSGRPYFVMELVKGIPITRYCDEHHLTPKQRLELFLPVCHAVQHAHQKGIIHRDLKPSNVLVAEYDDQPVPKVIDFGVAKATGAKLTARTMFTEFGQVVGTMEYMSPEQAKFNALDIDTRSDIYALGVLLYELLTGTTPFDRARLSKSAFDEMLRIIREEDPPKPSTRLSESKDALTSISTLRQTEPGKLTKLVRGELDWIVMKALEKDRNRRYDTASAMASDLQRYLVGDPVQAVPPSASYRLRKFMRRNRGPALAVTLALVILAAGAVGTTIGLVRAQHARREAVAAAIAENRAKQAAQAREAEMRAVLDFVEHKIFAAARPEGQNGGLGRDVKLREAIEAALPYVENSFQDQPLIEAHLRMTVGQSFLNLGDLKTAVVQYERARQLYTEHLGPYSPDTLRSMSGLAGLYDDAGRTKEALQLREETYRLCEARLGPNALETMQSMRSLASSYTNLGRYREGINLARQALALTKAKLGPDHPDTIRSLYILADAYVTAGQTFEAIKAYEEALRLLTARLGPDHLDALPIMAGLAFAYRQAGQMQKALELRQKAFELCKAKLGPDHRNTFASMSELADSYASLGRREDALKLYEQVLPLEKAKLGPNHPNTLITMYNMAAILTALDRGPDALSVIDDCLKQSAGTIVTPKLTNGLLLLRLRHFEKSNDAAGCRATAEMYEQLKHTDGIALYDGACMWAVAAAVQAKSPAADAARFAQQDADRAMAMLKQSVAAGHKLANSLRKDKDLHALRERDDFKKLLAELEALPNDRAWTLAMDPDPARRDPKRAVALAQQAVAQEPQNADYWNTLGVAKYRTGEWQGAVTALLKYRELRTNFIEWSNPFFLAMAHWRLGNTDEARQWRDKAIAWMESVSPQSPSLRRYRTEMEKVMSEAPGPKGSGS